EPDTIEDVYEPYLLQLGFIQRTPRGRVVTDLGREHVGAAPPSEAGPGRLFDAWALDSRGRRALDRGLRRARSPPDRAVRKGVAGRRGAGRDRAPRRL